MSTALTNESKNSFAVSNEAKSSAGTWAEHTETWADDGPGGNTWGAPGTLIIKESKNALTISNEAKQ